MTPFNDKRRHRRYAVDVMEIVGRAVFAIEAVIQDISITGVCLTTDRKLEVGTEYSLRVLGADLDMAIQGKVIWCSENDLSACTPEEAHLKYAAGLQITTLQQEAVLSLISFIGSHLVEKHTQVKVHEMSGCRCNVRFHLDHKEMATLNIDETYRVKQLSLGGMHFESNHTFELETRLHMRITIPANVPIDFVGRVISCIPSSLSPAQFGIGIEFKDMAEQDKIKLKEFIRRLYLEDAGFKV